MTMRGVTAVDVLTTAGYLLVVSLVEACNITVYSECVGGLTMDLHDRFTNESLFPVYDDATLENICRHMKSGDVYRCAKQVRSECRNGAEEEAFNSSFQVVEFLCKDGYQSYVRHRDCFSKEDVIASSSRCEASYTTSLGSAATPQNICRSMDKLLKCVKATVNDLCGQEPADWIIRVKSMNLQPTRSFIGCKNNDTFSLPVGVFAILISAGLLTMMAAMIPLVVCSCRLRKKRHLQAGVATTVAKNKSDRGVQPRLMAAEAVLTSSSDLHCCGPVHSTARDTNGKPRPPMAAESIGLNEMAK